MTLPAEVTGVPQRWIKKRRTSTNITRFTKDSPLQPSACSAPSAWCRSAKLKYDDEETEADSRFERLTT
jgi:hypothetical protein